MINIDDMTGWQTELHNYWTSDAYQDLPNHYPSPLSKIPLTIILQYMTLRLKNIDCVVAMIELFTWAENNQGKYPIENRQGYPEAAETLLNDFCVWYRFKSSAAFNDLAFRLAGRAATAIQHGDLPSVNSPETLTYLRQWDAQTINFEQ